MTPALLARAGACSRSRIPPGVVLGRSNPLLSVQFDGDLGKFAGARRFACASEDLINAEEAEGCSDGSSTLASGAMYGERGARVYSGPADAARRFDGPSRSTPRTLALKLHFVFLL